MGASLYSTGIYIPQNRVSVEGFVPADWSEEYKEKVVGIKQIPIAAPDEHASDLAAKASRHALERKGIDPRDVDVVIYCGLGIDDYGFWSPSAKVQHEIGAVNAFAFDLYQGCANSILALKLANDMLAANAQMNCILIAAGCRSGEWVEGRTTGNTFYSDGGAAAVITRDGSDWQIGPSISETKGYFHDVFHAMAGGTVAPPQSEGSSPLYRVQNRTKQQEDLKPIFNEQYVKLIAGLMETAEGPVYVNLMNYNKSLVTKMQERFDGAVQGWLNHADEYGHMGPCDPFLNFHLAQEYIHFPKGAVVINVVSGIGLSWSACRFDRVAD